MGYRSESEFRNSFIMMISIGYPITPARQGDICFILWLLCISICNTIKLLMLAATLFNVFASRSI